MLLDNEKRGKVHEWLAKYSKDGELDVVTGYFTVGALAWLSEKVNDKMRSQTFTVKLYSEEKLVSQCKIWHCSDFTSSESIKYSNSISSTNSFNEMFTVSDDGYRQFLAPSGMINMHSGRSIDRALSAKGVAELLWDQLIERLQR